MNASSPSPVIGLEIHAQLATRTKLFCGDLVDAAAPPNRHVCPVCLGLPGSLPLLNGHAVELAVRAALGLGCQVRQRSRFARKSYFYPDLPKGYQLTQRPPLAEGGELALDEPGDRTIRIRSLHLEEDTGRSSHDGTAEETRLDFGRAGVPLIEIVTEPDLRSPEEARRFLKRLRMLLRNLEVADCVMEEGGLRVDANVSLAGREGLTEIKNLNSFLAVARALETEIARQQRLRREGRPTLPLTMQWDAAAGELLPMRTKRAAVEYGYLPDPDLPEVMVPEEMLASLRGSLPVPPWERALHLVRAHAIAPEHAEALARRRTSADYYEAVVAAGAEPRTAATWLLGELAAEANARGVASEQLGLEPDAFAGLLLLAAERNLPRPLVRRILVEMLATGKGAEEITTHSGIAADSAPLEELVARELEHHPAEAARLRAGEDRLVDFFVGRVMRSTEGRADPTRAARLVRDLVAQ